jgi:hypothetical protein
MAEMDYPDRETFDAAMKSSENQAVAKDLMSFAKGKVKVLVAESDEESSRKGPRAQPPARPRR